MSESKLREAIAEPQRQMFYLVAGKIVFAHKEDPEQHPNSVDMNAIVVSKDGRFAVPQLGQAQQALQQGFFNRIGDEGVNVLDVTIQNLILLGSFTKDEFNQALPPVIETVDPNELQPN